MSMIECMDTIPQNAVIKVIGVGGGGGNAVERMLEEKIQGVEFICLNTDAQALRRLPPVKSFQLGEELTRGLGAGADPEVGRDAAISDRERIMEMVQGSDMVFIAAGMGGGTGTGAAPVVAEVARSMGILTVAVVTKPFFWEGKKRAAAAQEGLHALAQHVDSLITISNDKLALVYGEDVPVTDAFKAANNILFGAVQGIADLITRTGLINVDFADVRTVMSEMGMAMMGTGTASGPGRARKAAEEAVASPLLEDIDLTGAGGVLVNITATKSLSMGEFQEVGKLIHSFASENATVVMGTVIDPDMGDNLRVTVVVTGLGQVRPERTPPKRLEAVADGFVDYNVLDKPAVLRRQAVTPSSSNTPITSTPNSSNTVNTTVKKPSVAQVLDDTDYLDIPALWRRHEENR
jgi:cell division protein FtsZ